MFHRHLIGAIRAALGDTPVVVVQGARQVGKTTLLRSLLSEGFAAPLRSLDDEASLRAASEDPVSFLAGLGERAAIDEAQRVPALFGAIKVAVDRDRRPGRYLLSGSASVLNVPRLADSLAGRVELLTLWPLSQGELRDVREGFIDAVFSPRLPAAPRSGLGRAGLLRLALVGGYPEAAARPDPRRRDRWFASYLTTTLERDVKVFTQVPHLDRIASVLRIIGERSATVLNFAALASDTGIPETTLKRYVRVLQALFLVRTVPAWSRTRSRREIRAPKVFVVDSGLAAHLLGSSLEGLQEDGLARGRLVETFVAMEVLRQQGWSRTDVTLSHYRTSRKQEVDLVLEARDRRVVGIETKAAAVVDGRDFAGLRMLAEAVGSRFLRGIVLYAGEEPVQFGPNLWALPIPSLWELGATPVGSRGRE